MELIDPSKSKTVEFKHGDVTIIAKTEANEEDRLRAGFAGRAKGAPWTSEQNANFCKVVCQTMVIGWKGVTHEGKPVDYDFELLKHLPRIAGKNLFLELGLFLIRETDIQKGVPEEVKNA